MLGIGALGKSGLKKSLYEDLEEKGTSILIDRSFKSY